MHVILKRIAETTTVADVQDFIQPALKGGLFKKTGRIERILIQQLGSDSQEFHAIARIEPDSAGVRVVKLLNRKRCNGKPINLSEYHFRHRDNDRRASQQTPEHEKRTVDRRRKNLEIIDITAERKQSKIDYGLLMMSGGK